MNILTRNLILANKITVVKLNRFYVYNMLLFLKTITNVIIFVAGVIKNNLYIEICPRNIIKSDIVQI